MVRTSYITSFSSHISFFFGSHRETCRIIERLRLEFSNFLDPIHTPRVASNGSDSRDRARAVQPSMTRFEEGRDGGEAKEIDGQDEDEDVVADGT